MDEYLQDRYKNLVEKMVKEGSLPRALFKYRSLSSINTASSTHKCNFRRAGKESK